MPTVAAIRHDHRLVDQRADEVDRRRRRRSGRTRRPALRHAGRTRRRTPTSDRRRGVRLRSASWYDHETVARSVWCRSSVLRPLPRSRRNRSRRRSSSSSADSDRIRAAASSMASGMPSRRSQIWTSASRWPSGVNDASVAHARSQNNSTAAPSASSEGTRQTRSPRTRNASRLVARTCRFEQCAISCSTRTPTSSTRCSQLSITTQQTTLADPIDDRCRATIASPPTRTGNVDATAPTTAPVSETGARSTKNTPWSKSARWRWPNSIAARVLPTPPVPVSVTTLPT